MPHHCCVPMCTNDSRTKHNEKISYHSFPQDESIRKVWVTNIRRDIGENFHLNKHTRICSKHFDEDCYKVQVPGQVRRRLKKDAVPSIFAWKTPKPSRRKLFRTKTPKLVKSLVKSSTKKCVSSSSFMISNSFKNNDDLEDTDTVMEENNTNNEQMNVSNTSSTTTDDSLVDIEADPSPSKNSILKQHQVLLKDRANEKFSILRFSSSDSDIKFYTGFPTYPALYAFFQFLQPECNFLYYVGRENTSYGKPYEFVTKRGPSRSLSPLEELFLTLIRLRKGLQEKVIGDLYNLSEGHISKITNTWILFLYDRLRCLPIWPTREHVKKTMPSAFRVSYPETRVIIDCTEIFIEQPSASVCQRETFSAYKHHNTAKGLVGISPNGQITFISSLYAGRCSDKKIVRHCGLYDILEDGDSVMADKGFDIADDLEERGLTLTIPPFLQAQSQFTTQQLSTTKSIAAVRVHVERAVRKVKEFEILRNTVPISLCPMLDKTWTVCAHLANFTGSLIKQ